MQELTKPVEKQTNSFGFPISKFSKGRELTRRRFLRTGVASAAALGTLAASARSAPRGTRIRIRRLKGSRPLVEWKAPLDPQLLGLINRITYGYSRTTYDEVVAVGYQSYLESQLNPESLDDSDVENRLAGFDTLSMTTRQIYDHYAMNQSVPVVQLLEATMLRAVYSKRQLFERMVEFWTDHFNIDIQDGFTVFLKTADDRDVIRKHALTTFPQLLRASAHSGAMLYYLDNNANVVGHAQENYARELMELHSLGVDGGFTQNDVEEVARCLTGWTLADTDTQEGLGNFRFQASAHDTGAKTVLGVYIPANGGVVDGETVLDILTTHPSTAGFISRKLCKWFLGYDPPEDMVETVKATYLATGGDIKEMLRVILQPTVIDFMTTPKFKRPFHLLASALRATEADVALPRFVRDWLFIMGHVPFFWPTPDGYPDTLAAWGSGVLPRWQFLSELFIPAIPGVALDLQTLLDSEGGNVPGQQGTAIDLVLTGGQLSGTEVTMLQQLYDDINSTAPPALNDVFGVAASLPGFQWY